MLKKSASGVLASLRRSPYRNVRLASSLTAALLDSFFEHPDVIQCSHCMNYSSPSVGTPEFFLILLSL